MSIRAACALALAIVVADRVTKSLVVAEMQLGQSVEVISGFLSLTYLRNPGAAFGLLADAAPWRDVFLLVVASVAVVALAWMLVSTPREARWQRAAAAAVIGGALGNVYDRVAFGEVIDFIDVYAGTWHWPAFNVADSAITVGVCLLLITSFSQREPPQD